VRELDVDGNARPLLDRVLAEHAGVGSSATGDDDDAVDGLENLVADAVQLGQAHGVSHNAAEQRLGDSLGLLADLLGHEARPAALLGSGCVPVDLVFLGLDRVAVEVGHLDRVGADRGDLVLADLNGTAGVLDEGCDVGTQEVFPVTKTDNQGRVAASADDNAGLVLVDDEKGEGAVQAGDHLLEGLGDILGLLVGLANQKRGDLGVGVAREDGALGEQLFFQLEEVLDDAVVNEGELAVVTELRVRVAVGRSTVGCPAGVADTGGAVLDRVDLELVNEGLELARLLAGVDDAVGIDNRDSGGVVAPVLLATEASEEHLDALAVSDISNDSAHGREFYAKGTGCRRQ